MSGQPGLKVLHVIDTLGMGGAETWLMELLRLCAEQRVMRMDFLATSGNRGFFDDEARRLGAKVHYIRYGRAHLLGFAREFRRLLKEERYDVVHDHQDYASGWHFLCAAGRLPPVRITHVHNPSYQIRNNYGVTLGRRITARIGKSLVARYATHILGTSRQVVTEYGFDEPPFDGIKKQALHCAFYPARFLGDHVEAKASICHGFGWPEDARIVLFAGRMDQSPDAGDSQNHKNSGLAVDIGISAIRKEPKIRMLFAGAPSPALRVLEARVAAAGMAGSFRFAGVRQDIERLMAASDALLFPSRGEGLGMVAVEAQAAGLPVLASTAVPQECVVIPGLVHFLAVEAGAERWAELLCRIVVQERNVTDANRQVGASAFAIENCLNLLMNIYRGAQTA